MKISLDPQNPNIIWVGTGENVGGRLMGLRRWNIKSEDGGESWKNMGLKNLNILSKDYNTPKKFRYSLGWL